MLTPLLRAALTAMLALAGALPLAHADIYTWTDDKGRVNISNVEPPEGARVTSVLRENKALTAANEAAREAAREALREAEVRALAERVRQLQAEVELARRPAPPPVAAPTPVFVPYGGDFAPPPVQYINIVNATPSGGGTGGGCYSGWPDCTFGWYPGGFYPVSVVFPRERHFRRDHPVPTPHFRGPVAPWSPIPVPGSGRGH